MAQELTTFEFNYNIYKMCNRCEALSADIQTQLKCQTCVLLNIKQEPQTEITVTCHHCGVCLDMQMSDPANVEPFSCNNCAWKDDVNFLEQRQKTSDEMTHNINVCNKRHN